MSKRAFDKIAAGLDEALAIARGDAEPARSHRPGGGDVRSIRAKTGLSQRAFANRFGFSPQQVETWERGHAQPLGGLRAYLSMIDADHEAVVRMLDAARAGSA